MKIILTGSTGFIGSEVLSQCLRNPSITSIVTLTRRELPKAATEDPKLKAIVVKDFKTYPETVAQQLAGADACIWCMGTTAGNRELEVEYPLAFAHAFSETLPETKNKFRYIQLSGAASSRDQSANLWFKSEMRKMKGEAETNMLSFITKPETQGLWETLIVKSGFVIQKELRSLRDLMGWLGGEQHTIRVNELAAFMIDAAVNGWDEGKDTVSKVGRMVEKGREALASSA